MFAARKVIITIYDRGVTIVHENTHFTAEFEPDTLSHLECSLDFPDAFPGFTVATSGIVKIADFGNCRQAGNELNGPWVIRASTSKGNV